MYHGRKQRMLYQAWRDGRVTNSLKSARPKIGQFSLRFLLLSMTALAGLCAYLTTRTPACRNAAAILFALAGSLVGGLDHGSARGVGPLRGRAFGGAVGGALGGLVFVVIETVTFQLANLRAVSAFWWALPYQAYWWMSWGALFGAIFGCAAAARDYRCYRDELLMKHSAELARIGNIDCNRSATPRTFGMRAWLREQWQNVPSWGASLFLHIVVLSSLGTLTITIGNLPTEPREGADPQLIALQAGFEESEQLEQRSQADAEDPDVRIAEMERRTESSLLDELPGSAQPRREPDRSSDPQVVDPETSSTPGLRPAEPPVCVGWDGGWVAYSYSSRDGRWESRKSPPCPLSRLRGSVTVGRRGAAVLLDVRRPGSGGWLFDRASSRWTQIPPPPAAGGRTTWATKPTTFTFVDHRIILWSGSHRVVFNTLTREWSAIPDAPIANRHRAHCGVIGKKLLVWGGYGPITPRRGGPLQDGAVFDLDRNSWENMPTAPIPFVYGMADVTWRGRLVVVGGTIKGTVKRGGAMYAPDSRSWEIIPDAPFDIGAHAAHALSGDQLFLWSGTDMGGRGAIYDFRTRQWSRVPEAPISQRQLAFACAVGQKVFVWGGWDPWNNHPDASGDQSLQDGAAYDMTRGSWEMIPRMPGGVPYALHPGW
ncbi:MAG: Kelch repeat-containing protein [Planctomycetota bacterium]|jgi:hypothetical protein